MKTKGITERFSINLHSFLASIWAFKKTGQVKATLYPSAAVPAGVLGQLSGGVPIEKGWKHWASLGRIGFLERYPMICADH